MGNHPLLHGNMNHLGISAMGNRPNWSLLRAKPTVLVVFACTIDQSGLFPVGILPFPTCFPMGIEPFWLKELSHFSCNMCVIC